MSRKYVKSRLRANKELLVKGIKENGRCLDCQTTTDLTFHHLEPALKVGTIPSLIRDDAVSLLFLRNEIAKCILLCRACHNIRHAIDNEEVLQHTHDHE